MVFSLAMLQCQLPKSFSLPATAVGVMIKLNVTCCAHPGEWCSGLSVHVEVVALAWCVSCLAKHKDKVTLQHLSDSWAFAVFYHNTYVVSVNSGWWLMDIICLDFRFLSLSLLVF